MKTQLTFNDLKSDLSTDDIDQILMIITYKCRIKTYLRLRSCLHYTPHLIKPLGILDRLIKENGKWGYTAGQSYNDEIRTVRDCILGKV